MMICIKCKVLVRSNVTRFIITMVAAEASILIPHK